MELQAEPGSEASPWRRLLVALLRRFFAARSIIEVSLRPLKLTGQAQLCLGKRTGTRLAALLLCTVNAAGLAGVVAGRNSCNC